MSHYENYGRTSSDYDTNRVPVGLRIIRRALDRARPANGEVRLLDAGCGTGAYLAALQGPGVAPAGLDLDPGMLARARQKLRGPGHPSLVQGSVLSMPYAGATFDLVMFNQVLHHLDGEAGEAHGWPNLRRALAQARRVLRPGGALLINTCAQRQLTEGFWYAPLIPQAVERIARRYVPVDGLERLLEAQGFALSKCEVPLDETFYGERALDPTGPFDERWRNGDSVWALTTADELQQALTRLGTLEQSAATEVFIMQREQARRRSGQCTFVEARRLPER